MKGGGTTSQQIQNAKQGAVFVWVDYDLWHPKRLARDLGREDLLIVGQEWLTSDLWRGRRFTDIVVDHACELSEKECAILEIIRYTQIEGDRTNEHENP